MTGIGHNETDRQDLTIALSLECIGIGRAVRNLFNAKGKQVLRHP